MSLNLAIALNEVNIRDHRISNLERELESVINRAQVAEVALQAVQAESDRYRKIAGIF